MVADLKIRPSKLADLPAIDELYRTAFPDEDLLPLVRSLLSDQYDLVSMVGTIGQDLITHVIFTKGSVERTTTQSPSWHRSLLRRHGKKRELEVRWSDTVSNKCSTTESATSSCSEIRTTMGASGSPQRRR